MEKFYSTTAVLHGEVHGTLGVCGAGVGEDLILGVVQEGLVVGVTGRGGDALADGGVDAEGLSDCVGDGLEGVGRFVVDGAGGLASLGTHGAACFGGGHEGRLAVNDFEAADFKVDDDGGGALVGDGPAELADDALDTEGDLVLGALLGVLEGALVPVEFFGDDVLVEDGKSDGVQVELTDELFLEVEIEMAFVGDREGSEEGDFDRLFLFADHRGDVTIESIEDVGEVNLE